MLQLSDFECSQDRVEIVGLDGMTAGQWRTFAIKVTLADTDLAADNTLVLGVPFGFSLPQMDDLQAEGYVSLHYDGEATMSLLPCDRESTGQAYDRYVRCVVEQGAARAGETLTLTFGDGSQGSPGCRTAPQAFERVNFECFRQRPDEAIAVTDFPVLPVASGACAALRLHLTPTFRSGERCCLTVVAEDRYGNRCPDYRGRLTLDNPAAGTDLPEAVELGPADRGVKRIEFTPRDALHLRISASDGAVASVSNAAVRLEEDFPYRLYFGEIHAHTEMSMDGWGGVEEAYEFARDTAVLDFAATADHQILLTGEPTSSHPFMSPLFRTRHNAERWQATCAAARNFNQPGRFVTFPGVELSPLETDEDINLYFLEDEPEMMDPEVRSDKVSETFKTMNAYLARHRVMAIPHHPATSWRIWHRDGEGLHDFFQLDREKMPVIEMFSKHGNSEHFGNRKPLLGNRRGRSLQDIFAAGHRFGVIGGSDTHYGNPGSHMREPGPYVTLQYQNGLAGVWARELTREALWDAFFARRTCATTGRKTVVFFQVDDTFIGEDGSGGPPRRIRLRAWGGDRITKVEVLKNNEYLAGDAGRQHCHRVALDYVDETESSQAVDFYQARITESGDEMTWTTPIWIA